LAVWCAVEPCRRRKFHPSKTAYLLGTLRGWALFNVFLFLTLPHPPCNALVFFEILFLRVRRPFPQPHQKILWAVFCPPLFFPLTLCGRLFNFCTSNTVQMPPTLPSFSLLPPPKPKPPRFLRSFPPTGLVIFPPRVGSRFPFFQHKTNRFCNNWPNSWNPSLRWS